MKPEIAYRPIDHWVNATILCKSVGRDFNEWYELRPRDENLINRLDEEVWVNPALFVDLLNWIDTKFAKNVEMGYPIDVREKYLVKDTFMAADNFEARKEPILGMISQLYNHICDIIKSFEGKKKDVIMKFQLKKYNFVWTYDVVECPQCLLNLYKIGVGIERGAEWYVAAHLFKSTKFEKLTFFRESYPEMESLPETTINILVECVENHTTSFCSTCVQK